jgi:hypothetical protein
MNRLFWINRVLWGLLGLLTLAYGSVLIYLHQPLAADASPLAVPSFTYGVLPLPSVGQPISRNPFDRLGQTWHSPGQGQSEQEKTDITLLGIITVPGSQGIFTTDRFVPLGGIIDGARLIRVTPDKAILRTQTGVRALSLTTTNYRTWNDLMTPATTKSSPQ